MTIDKSNEIRVVVGLDFGTTFSGFAYCHVKESQNVTSNVIWQGEAGQLKTNTVLKYDDKYSSVKSWGAPALAKKPSRREKKQDNKGDRPIEKFKLHLGDIPDKYKPYLPSEIGYEKAITDYLRKIGEVIKDTVKTRWPVINDYFKSVLLVFTIPAEFSEKVKAIMRRCAKNAELINKEDSVNLQFTTEPEAAAVYCKNNDLEPGSSFMIVDCGGGTVDLTTRKILDTDQLAEMTERTGDFCGSTFIDDEFIRYLREKLGDGPMDSLRDKNYGQMQYLIQQFCKFGKIPFTGDDQDFVYELDIRETAPTLKEYITDANIRKILENDEWVIEIDFETTKSIFEPAIKKILHLIEAQLRNMHNTQETCSAMFLVGGFSESKYLQKRIKQEFKYRVNNISVPPQPMAAIARGAAMYGLSIKSVISSRVLKYTYGVAYGRKWEKGDPVNRKRHDGTIINLFKPLAKRGDKMNIDQEVTCTRVPMYPDQTRVTHHIYYTREYNTKYCDEPGMKLLGEFSVDLPGSGTDRSVLFGMTFGKMEVAATSKIASKDKRTDVTFKYNYED